MSFGEPTNPYSKGPDGAADQPGASGPGAPGGFPPPQPGQTPGYGIPQQPGPAGYGPPPNGPEYGYPPGFGYQQPQFGQNGMPELAHWGLRFVALLIDSIVTGLPSWILGGLGAAIGGNGGDFLSLLGSLISFGLFIWLLIQVGRTGQTVGKKTMKIRLLREADGQTLGFGMALVRYLAHLLDYFACFLGFLWPLWDSKKQTFADKICSTVVIRSR